ncbi:hypothetical protein GZ78_26040 [Endozoicomonas numazuensis]|uniref:Uncharacterized protein n=1 Tax=Endozoicomonas numazuensis TaxID=1137799 RepID=A0A081N6L4_9GAMM|nr:hypothetical protein GZ78_26040 [Endozoicomonas numazuensis]
MKTEVIRSHRGFQTVVSELQGLTQLLVCLPALKIWMVVMTFSEQALGPVILGRGLFSRHTEKFQSGL